MRFVCFGLFLLFLVSCARKETSHNYSSVSVEIIFTDTLSIRAIELMEGSLAFAANKGTYGLVDLRSNQVKTSIQHYDSIIPEYRAVAHTSSDFFMLSAGNPALLYKTGNRGQMELVYLEEHPDVFYDALLFLNDLKGIAVGDSMNGCLSILLTLDGGKSWKKVACEDLPEAQNDEGAFAASNTNLVAIGNTIWIGTTQGNIYKSEDSGESWQVVKTPLLKESPTQGIYSLDFYDVNIGVAMGGDYTQPEVNRLNKVITKDGGLNWVPIADGNGPGYTSCVQFVPNSGGNDIVALGADGIYYSNTMGESWKKMAEDTFYTLRFLNDSTAYAAGKNKIAKLILL